MDDATDRLTRLEPGALFAGYRIEGLLDRGGMGVVYKAVDADLDRTVALKIIAPEHTQNPDAVERFKAEARLAASLEHPNIVPIHRGGEFDGVLYLAMRFVPGTNLRKIVDRGQLEMDQIGRVIVSVAAALDVAHQNGLVHRDVKPANILISGEGEHEHVYLTDFGLTKRLGSAGSLTRTGAWVGTPDYVAPEQIQAGRIDGRADVYSLGCVLYEMLTGSVAFPRDNDMAKLWAHVTDPPPPPSLRRADLVKAFDDVVARATAKDPDERYSKASELATAVGLAISGQKSKPDAAVFQATRTSAGASATPIGQHDVFIADPTHSPGEPAREEPQGTVGSPPQGSPPQGPPSGAPPPGTVGPPPQGPPSGAPPPGTVGPPPPGPPSGAPPQGTVGPPPQGPPGDAQTGLGGPGGSGGGGWLSRHWWPVAAGLALVACGAAAVLVVTSGSSKSGSSKKASLSETVPATLEPVPTNNVTAVGNATVQLKGNVATVTLNAKGLLNKAPHAMHIHAGALGQCPPAGAAQLHNGHRTISTGNGGKFYGHPRVSLTTSGDTSPVSILEFPRYPATGNITYKRTIKLTPTTARLVRKSLAVIVVHGIDYNGNGVYDATLGASDLNPALQGETTAPALCGSLVPTGSRQQAAGTQATAQLQQRPEGPRVYTASLTVQTAVPRWLCFPRGTAG